MGFVIVPENVSINNKPVIISPSITIFNLIIFVHFVV